jgi:hypothetical protein
MRTHWDALRAIEAKRCLASTGHCDGFNDRKTNPNIASEKSLEHLKV